MKHEEHKQAVGARSLLPLPSPEGRGPAVGTFSVGETTSLLSRHFVPHFVETDRDKVDDKGRDKVSRQHAKCPNSREPSGFNPRPIRLRSILGRLGRVFSGPFEMTEILRGLFHNPLTLLLYARK